MIYRKKIHHWFRKYGEYHTVWYYTKGFLGESEDRYSKIEEKDLPPNIQALFENRRTSAVIQDFDTKEILEIHEFCNS